MRTSLAPLRYFLTFAVLLTFTASGGSVARAGDWSFELVGPGDDPANLRVRITVTPVATNECDHCHFVIGSFGGHITPGPPSQTIGGPGCLEELDFDETGATFASSCIAQPGAPGDFEIDLDPHQDYLFEGTSIMLWIEGGCQGGACCPDAFCNEVDDQFVPLVVPALGVAIEQISLSTLKAAF